MRFYTCSLPTMHPSWKCCGRRRGTPVLNTGSREGWNFKVSLIWWKLIFLGSYEGRNIDRNFLAKLKVCDKIFFDSAQRYRAMHEVRQSFAILKSQACTTTASWEFCINLTFTEQFIFDENPQSWQFWCRKISPASRFHDFAEMLFVTNLYWPKHLQEAK